jgi:hypothetical protein
MSDAVERAKTHTVFVEQVRRELPDHSDKLDALRDVESLFEHPGWALVERLVRRKAEDLVEMMDSGAAGVRPHADYIAHHAERYGMREVLDLPHTIRWVALESIRHEEARAGREE